MGGAAPPGGRGHPRRPVAPAPGVAPRVAAPAGVVHLAGVAMKKRPYPPTYAARPRAHGPRPPAAPLTLCSECPTEITPQQAAVTRRHTGAARCPNCYADWQRDHPL